MSMRFAVALALALLVPTAASAVKPDEILPDPKLETRARQISEGLRCMVCQNESIDDSDAGLARDLRLLVRERLKQGDSDGAIRDLLISRYGDFILLKPPFKLETVLLWSTPLLVLLGGGAGAFFALRRRNKALAPAGGLSEDEQARLNRLLSEG